MAYERFKPLTELVTDATKKLRQAAGPGVQLYSEHDLMQYIQDIYDQVTGDKWWPHLMEWYTRTLDETTGIVTEDLDEIEDFVDIRAIYANNDQQPLPLLSNNVNPHTMTGTTPRMVEPLAYNHTLKQRLFRVWPLTSVATVYVHARKQIDGIFSDPEVVVPFEPALLAMGAAYAYAASEGINNTHVDKLGKDYNDMLQSINQAYKSMPLVKDPRVGYPPDQWQESWR